MSTRPTTFTLRAAAAFALTAASAAPAPAQFLGFGSRYDDCGCSTAAIAPVQQTAQVQTVCQQTAMVVQPQYRQVPVTEYQPYETTVRKPRIRTTYVDEEVTVYKPVTETKTASVPVSRQVPVTQMQTVMRDQGYWNTNYTPNCRVSPCEYDGRPGLLGWMNRTGYNIRSMFTPRYSVSRNYVQNMVAQQVPVTQYVAQNGTQQVQYQVTRMVPTRETRKVARNEVEYVDEKVTAMRPVTTYRTVPAGTSIAYAPIGTTTSVAYGLGGTSVAYGGFNSFGGGSVTNVAMGPIDWSGGGSSRTALAPTPDDNFSRSAENTDEFDDTRRDGGSFDSVPYGDDFGVPPQTSITPIFNREMTRNEPAGALKVPTFRKVTAADRDRIMRDRMLADRGDAPAFAGPAVASAVRWAAHKPEAAAVGPVLAGPQVASLD
ncbi:MAG: hypothetical protein AAGJ97_13525 [Planctomycetota bacterium]